VSQSKVKEKRRWIMKKAIIVWLVIMILVAFGFLGFSTWVNAMKNELQAPTSGAKITTYAQPKKALLVMDIQEDFTGKNAKQPYRQADILVGVTNRIIDYAHASGFIVIYIKNEYEKPNFLLNDRGITIKGQPGTAIDARIHMVNQHIFTKGKADAFSNPAFEKFLKDNQVNEVFLTGLDAAYCVLGTAKGGRNRGYQVTVFGDGIATESGKKLTEILEEYQKFGISAISSTDFYQDKFCPVGKTIKE
jgi:nicotinamidase-related amidase